MKNCKHCYHSIWRNSETQKQGLKCCYCGDYKSKIRTAQDEFNIPEVKLHGIFVQGENRYFEAKPEKPRFYY